MKKIFSIALFATVFILAGHNLHAAEKSPIIQYRAIDLTNVTAGEDLWQYQYKVSNYSFSVNQGFDIYFDLAQGFMPNDIQSNPTSPNTDWAVNVLIPDPGLGVNGAYDAQSLQSSASLADTFKVNFIWRGQDKPGVQAFEIYNDSFQVVGAGNTILMPLSNIDTANPFYLVSEIGVSVNPVFEGGTLRIDKPETLRTDAFSLDGRNGWIGVIDGNGFNSTFTGVFSDIDPTISAGLAIANSGIGGAVTLTGRNSYTGNTIINSNASLALANQGSIASSSKLINNGIFNIAATESGAAINSLSGKGIVILGDQTLNLTQATDTFAGQITGSGGLTLSGGNETLTGSNSYTGNTIINSNASLSLANQGSIASSNKLNNNGVFNIADSGAAINSLSGNGIVILGNQTLSLTQATDTFAGQITGSGGLTLSGGSETLTGNNNYTGNTIINSNASLSLVSQGSIASSSKLFNNGIFNIAATESGAAISSLSGNGTVMLGTQTMNLTQAADNFAGQITGSGGLNLSGGSETLTGSNNYTGNTTINSNASLSLVSQGSIASSSKLINNGVFNIADSGAAINILSGNGIVMLGTQTLNLTQAADNFAGQITGSGGLTLSGGSEILTGSNSYTGGTIINTGTVLQLGNAGTSGSIAGNISNNGRLIFNRSDSINFNGVVNGTGSLTQQGAGVLNLTGNNTLGGGTFVDQGTLAVNGILNSQVFVAKTAALRGIGLITEAITNNGTLAPGNSPGTLNSTATVAMNAGSSLQVDIDGTGIGNGAGNYSRLLITGTNSQFIANGDLNTRLRNITGSASNSFTPHLGDNFRLVTAQGGILGHFASFDSTSPGLASDTRFDVFYHPNSIDL